MMMRTTSLDTHLAQILDQADLIMAETQMAAFELDLHPMQMCAKGRSHMAQLNDRMNRKVIWLECLEL
jgi:hypothetical protein